jgi:tight adherence protein B
MSMLALWGLGLLFAICFGGLAYALMSAMREAMDAYEDVYAAETARQFEDVFLFISPRKLIEIARIGAVAMFLVCFFIFGGFSSGQSLMAGFFTGAIGALAAMQAPRITLQILRQRRLLRFNNQLVDALVRMSNSLKAGFSILQAFEAVAKENQNPISQEFGVFLHQIRVGVRFEQALGELEKRVGSEDLTLTVRAIEIARMTGGSLTDVLEQIAATVRERMRIEGKIRSLTAQGRLQGIVASLMPVFLLLALSFIDPQMVQGFVTSGAGIGALAFAGLLILAGAVVMRKIMRIQV